MKICVFCSSSSDLDEKYYRAARDFGSELALRGHALVYGGYDRGMMGEVARSAAAGGSSVIAVVPAIFDRPGFTWSGCAEVLKTRDLRDRKETMERVADAFAVLPGGVGTFDEFFEVYSLIATGQLDKPAAALNVGGFYDSLKAMLDRCRDEGFLKYGGARVSFYATPAELLDALGRQL